MSGTLAGVTSLGSEVVLYVKIEWLPNGAQNVRFLAGFSLNVRCHVCNVLYGANHLENFLSPNPVWLANPNPTCT